MVESKFLRLYDQVVKQSSGLHMNSLRNGNLYLVQNLIANNLYQALSPYQQQVIFQDLVSQTPVSTPRRSSFMKSLPNSPSGIYYNQWRCRIHLQPGSQLLTSSHEPTTWQKEIRGLVCVMRNWAVVAKVGVRGESVFGQEHYLSLY